MPFRWPIAVCVVAWSASVAPAQTDWPPTDPQVPLRYALRTGDQLVYERRALASAPETGGGRRAVVDHIRLWCLAQQGQERLVLLVLTRTTDGRAEPARGAVFYLDARGRRRWPDVMQTRLADVEPVFEIFPELRPALEMDANWTTSPDLYGRQWRCTRGGADPRVGGHVRVDFSMNDPTGVAGFLGQSLAGSYWFDVQAGAVTRVESLWRGGGGARRRALTVLRARERRAENWCARRALETRSYLRALRHEDRYLQRIIDEPQRLERTLVQLERLWQEFASGLRRETPAPLRELAAAHLRYLAQRRERLRARAWLGEHWLGQTAADWSLQDPAGVTIDSGTLRDRYTVECFWSTASLWSLRAFETLRRLRSELGDGRVHVVCLNLDRDAELARQAARQCGAGLTTVLVGPPVVGAAPPELPVFRVVDRQGKIVGVFVGWRPSLAKEVSALLRE